MKKINVAFNLTCYAWLAVLLLGLSLVFQLSSRNTIILAILFFSLVDLVLERVAPALLLKVIAALFVVQRSFYVGSFFDRRWLGWLRTDLVGDWHFFQSWGYIQSPVTGLLVSLVLAAALQSMYFVFLSRRKGAIWLLFFGSSLLISASILQGINVGFYLFLYVVLGLVIMATVNLQRQFTVPLERWLSVLLVWMLCLSAIAWALPSGEEALGEFYRDLKDRWDESEDRNDPRGIFRAQTGYSMFDDNLGGAVVQSFTPVLSVTAPRPIYLRGESRHYYTGKGWGGGEAAVWVADLPFEDSLLFQPQPRPGREIEVKITVLDILPGVLFVPRYPLTISFGNPATSLWVNGIPDYFGDYEFLLPASQTVGDSYTIMAFIPEDNPDLLREFTSGDADSMYLQLPQDLPGAVRDLALQITEQHQNNFDKAEAIRHYLRTNYNYTLDTARPGSGDFVNDFLFETKEGYCVHFSTAFVVLARAAGIPARWVKGFSPGSPSSNQYIVLAKDAHAWAEIWFDDYGWVPFEPTPGWGQSAAPAPNPQQPDEPVDPEVPVPITPNQPVGPDPTPLDPSPGRSLLGNLWLWLAVVAGVISTAILMILVARKRAQKGLIGAYRRLQQRMSILGWQRRVWETPREHARRFRPGVNKILVQVAGMLESVVYGGRKGDRQLETRFRRLCAKLSYARLAVAGLFRLGSRRGQ